VYGNVALTGRPAFYENYSVAVGRHFEVSAYCPRPKQFAVILVDVTERRTAEEDVRRRVVELEMLYQSGLALSQLLNPAEIGRKILELLEEKLNWRHTRIRLYHPQGDLLELLDFNQPGLSGEEEHRKTVERFQSLITHAGEGMSGWVVQHGIPVRCGDVENDRRYVEAYPGIHSGLYVPMKLGERVVGVISIEDEKPNAFTEADERLVATLANQATSAFENARLFAEIRQRVVELETLNRVSLVLRSASNREEMLAIILDEALFLLNTPHGSIELYNKSTESFDKVVTRGWAAEVRDPPQTAREGIIGRVFTSGEIYVTREFVSDPEARDAARVYLPSGWGGACLPIRASQQALGVMLVSVPSGRELNKDEIRLLSIFSEMTGAALQRMQLHEQTARRLEQLNALRAVDQAISSSRDMQLTLNILLPHTISQLNLDAAEVLLHSAGSSKLEFAAGQGFRTLPPRVVGLNDRFAGRAVMQRRLVSMSDFDSSSQVPQPGKAWRDEGFLRGWCLPLIIKGEVKGVLEVYCRRAFIPDAEWIEFLETFAGQAAIAIDNTQLFENLQRANVDLSLAYEATIEGWSRALDMRDHETEGHALRVTELTLSLARTMGVGELQLADIRRGALLHDIGKMGVPDAILLKDGNLTEEEWSIMRRHPQLARDMLLPITYLKDAFDIPYCHHEKWDGTGYPQGLKGEQIPLAARIFAIVDVWDALTNDRTYRRKWEKQKVLEYIREQSGFHFDPQVVEVFLRYIGRD
jgi:putative nucleotidyltransferase with HDIG domain